MMQRDDAAVRRFIERFALDLAASGMPRMPARVFAGLLSTDSGSLTAGELADLLQVSPASVSGAVRYLEQLALVVREREPGSRRDHYRVDQDVWHELYAQRDRLLLQWTDTVRDGRQAVGPDTPAGLRLAETLAFFEFVHDELVDMNKRWEVRRSGLRREWGID
ncbi:MAG TPA: MarR family transcriptional regulator [Euzebyales bacterium]|nr:MarR family transcriptional regulator [Euzebyales bacterium]